MKPFLQGFWGLVKAHPKKSVIISASVAGLLFPDQAARIGAVAQAVADALAQ